MKSVVISPDRGRSRPSSRRAWKNVNSVFHALVAIVCILTMLIAAILFVDTFVRHRAVQMAVQQVLSDIRNNVTVRDSTSYGKLVPEGAAYADRIESLQKAAFDSNTVSFVFSFVVLCMVTIGSFLLLQTRARLREAENVITDASEWREVLAKSTAVTMHYTRLHQMIVAVRHNRSISLLALSRESLLTVEEHLRVLSERGKGFDPSLFEAVTLNIALVVDRELDDLPYNVQERSTLGLDDLQERSARCLKALERLGARR